MKMSGSMVGLLEWKWTKQQWAWPLKNITAAVISVSAVESPPTWVAARRGANRKAWGQLTVPVALTTIAVSSKSSCVNWLPMNSSCRLILQVVGNQSTEVQLTLANPRPAAPPGRPHLRAWVGWGTSLYLFPVASLARLTPQEAVTPG
jgi:hypothetical protein